MAQSAAVRPEPNLQRKAALAYAGARDHRGKVQIESVPDFDLNRTIFQTLESPAARYMMKKRVGVELHWSPEAASTIESAYSEATSDLVLPPISDSLKKFLLEQCNFDVEHADGSFLDHLYFCFEYTTKYYTEGSPLVGFLHSILGTGTNTFAMQASKIPQLQELMSHEDWKQVEAFPTLLRLLYAGDLRAELRQNVGREVRSISMHRVIDNAPLELTGAEFWDAMNHQLVHLVDFMPAANWAAHLNDTSFILFRDVYDLMDKAGQRKAIIEYTPADGPASLQGEKTGVGGWLTSKIPVGLAEKMAAKSIRRFSEQCGHSLEYRITWG